MRTSKSTVLIVDDERVIADTLALILAQHGYDCAVAVEARHARRVLRGRRGITSGPESGFRRRMSDRDAHAPAGGIDPQLLRGLAIGSKKTKPTRRLTCINFPSPSRLSSKNKLFQRPIVRSLVRVPPMDQDFTKAFVLPMQNATMFSSVKACFVIVFEPQFQIALNTGDLTDAQLLFPQGCCRDFSADF